MSITINGSGSISGLTAGAGVPAFALSGQVPDANAPSGSVIQVVQATNSTQTSTTSNSLTDTGLSASITPSSSSSKILVVATQNFHCSNNANNRDEAEGRIALLRNSIILQDSPMQVGIVSYSQAKRFNFIQTLSYLDSPGTISSVTYKTMMRTSGYETITANNGSVTATILLLEISA